MIRHRKHVLSIGTHDIDALVSHAKLLFPPFFLESKFIRQMRQTLILIIITNLLVIGHHKHIFLFGIHDIDYLVLREKLFLPLFSSELKFVHKMSQIWILARITNLFEIGQYKQVLLIWIHDIDALILHEKLLFAPFSLESMFIHEMR